MTLEARALCASYPSGPPVLRDLTASFTAGGLTAVIGPNGAGKSTLLRALAGLLTPDRGQAILGSVPVLDIPASVRARRIVYIPQASRVGFAFSALSVVRMGLYAALTSARDSAAMNALERVGLADRADDPFATLSAGQQQRVTLARALAQVAMAMRSEPCAVLADEPVSAMDPLHARRALELLAEIARSGVTVVVVLHDLTAALRHAGHALLVSRDGRAHCSGPVAEVLTPARLEPVFGVPFRAFEAAGRTVALVPD